MKIWSYIIAAPDDVDVLPDAISSLACFSDRIYVIDGGNRSLIHHPRYVFPLRESLTCAPRFLGENTGRYGKVWDGVHLILIEHPLVSYGPQRNWTLEMLKNEPDQCDWLVWIDADEVCSWQLINGIRSYLAALPNDCEGITVKWLNLVQDEQHYANSDWLAHPRIVKIGNHSWSGSVHEHMLINRDKLERWDVRIIHTRALFRRRLLVQRSHPKLIGSPDPFWGSATMGEVYGGISWPKLHYPEKEILLPFESNALDTWDELGNLK